MNDNVEGNVFINGRAQILEMFQYLNSEERERLLKQIKIKNPQLAAEIVESSIQFKDIIQLSDDDISLILSHVKAPILGVALKSLKVNEQRRVLSLCSRDFAEDAFKVMSTRLVNEARDIERACAKIKAIMAALSKRNKIRL
jgi:flagellar motor switch protein FliG